MYCSHDNSMCLMSSFPGSLTVLGITTTYQNFPQGYGSLSLITESSTPRGMAYDPIGVACVALSLITNIAATSLIGYKTWYIASSIPSEYFTSICFRIHRRTLKGHQVGGKKIQSRGLSTLMLIVESGVGYCLLWVCIRPAYPIYSELYCLADRYCFIWWDLP